MIRAFRHDGDEHENDAQTMTYHNDDGEIDAGIRSIQSVCVRQSIGRTLYLYQEIQFYLAIQGKGEFLKSCDRRIYQEHPESEEKMILHPDRGYFGKYRDFC